MKFYDDRHDDGAYDALSDLAKVELFRLVKKGLEFGLGEAWSDYLDAAMDEALRYRQIDTDPGFRVCSCSELGRAQP